MTQPETAAQHAGHVPPEPDQRVELFRRWLDLSELNRRAYLALQQEVTFACDLVESGVSDLIACFRALSAAVAAQQQCLRRPQHQPPVQPGELQAACEEISQTVARLVTCLQFHDRTNQHMQHISDTLSVLGAAAASLQTETLERVAGLAWQGGLDEAWQHRILAGQMLGAVRERFLGHLLPGAPGHTAQVAAATCDDSSIDLF